MRTLIINNSNVVAGYNNSKYTYQFMGGGFVFEKGDQIALQSIQIPYSWRNITSNYNNNIFNYVLNGVSYQIRIPDGFYTMTDLNALFQSIMYTNGHYLVDESGNIVYYAQLSTNVNVYGIQFDAFAIPATLPTNYLNPANVFYNTVTFTNPTCIQLSIPNTNIQQLIGYKTGIYPSVPQSTVYSIVSTSTPNLSPVNSILIRCNICSNKHCNPPDAFFCFSPNVSYGANINIQPTIAGWIDCITGSFASFDITFVDQNFVPLAMLDNNITIQLLIKSKGE